MIIRKFKDLNKAMTTIDANRAPKLPGIFFGEKPDIEINFDCLEVSSKAKLTDKMSALKNQRKG